MTNDSTGYGPGTPPPAGPGPSGRPGAPSGDGFFGSIRRIGITRGQDRWIGGVASGLAERFGLDPLLVRGLVGLSILMGFGLVLYGVAWALLPEPDGRIHLEQAIHGDWDGGLIGAGLAVLIGLTSGGWWFTWGPFDSGWFSAIAWSAAIVAVIILAANARKERRGPSSTPEGQAPMTDPTPPAAPRPAAGPVPPRTTAGVPTPGPAFTAAAPQTPPAPPYTGAPRPGAHHGTAPYWQQPRPGAGRPPQPPRPPKPVKPPKPPKPYSPGPGSAITGAVVGLILIALAVLMIADRTGDYTGPVASVVVGGGVVLVGLAIMLCGILGRRSGGLTGLAIIGLVVAGPALAADSDSTWRTANSSVALGDRSYEVTSRADAQDGFSLGIGSTEIDLTDVPLRTNDTLVVPIQAGLGNVTVTVPDGVPVLATVRSGGGTIYWDLDDNYRTVSGVGNSTTFSSRELQNNDDATAQIELRIDLGLGDVTIEED